MRGSSALIEKKVAALEAAAAGRGGIAVAAAPSFLVLVGFFGRGFTLGSMAALSLAVAAVALSAAAEVMTSAVAPVSSASPSLPTTSLLSPTLCYDRQKDDGRGRKRHVRGHAQAKKIINIKHRILPPLHCALLFKNVEVPRC